MIARFMTPLFLSLAVAISLFSCTPTSASPDTPDPEKPNPDAVEPKIVSARLSEYPKAVLTIDEKTYVVDAELPFGSILGSATLEMDLAEGCKSDPVSGSSVDLRKTFPIFVTAPNGASRKYTFSARVAASDIVKIKWFELKDYYIRAELDGSDYLFTLPYGADLKNLKIDLATDYKLTTEPDIASGIDLSEPREIKVYAEDGKTFKTYTLKARHFAKDVGVRGVYLPSPSHTSSFSNYANLCESMDLLQELNFNCLYVCAWAATKTAWPSEVLLANSTYSDVASLNMYRSYTGGSGDAIADMISEGHKRGIKVVLWFEYGFMHKVGSVDMNDPLLAKHPDWIGLNSGGGYCNYNGTDFYLNSFSAEVQKFMIDLVVEAVRRYPELDGIQGDDRLPASPINAGYNKETVDAYMTQTGKPYPSDNKNKDWQAWKLASLNRFALDLHDAVKAERQSCMVFFAPNKYPWACNNLSQDWPSWVKSGACEFLTVQCYVTANYERDVDSQIAYMKANTSKNIFQPAMILKNGANLMSPQMLSEQLCHNRKVGTMCEAQFWFDGLWNEDIRKMFKLFYSYPVEFPEL